MNITISIARYAPEWEDIRSSLDDMRLKYPTNDMRLLWYATICVRVVVRYESPELINILDDLEDLYAAYAGTEGILAMDGLVYP